MPHNGIIFGINKNELLCAATWMHCTKWKEPDSKYFPLFDRTHTTLKKWQNYSEREQVCICQGLGLGWGCDYKGAAKENLGGGWTVLYPNYGSGCTIQCICQNSQNHTTTIKCILLFVNKKNYKKGPISLLLSYVLAPLPSHFVLAGLWRQWLEMQLPFGDLRGEAEDKCQQAKAGGEKMWTE